MIERVFFGLGAAFAFIHALGLTGQRWMGALMPLGGVCLLGAWGLLAWAALRG